MQYGAANYLVPESRRGYSRGMPRVRDITRRLFLCVFRLSETARPDPLACVMLSICRRDSRAAGILRTDLDNHQRSVDYCSGSASTADTVETERNAK